jgi:hypothetical protein
MAGAGLFLRRLLNLGVLVCAYKDLLPAP